jgi:glycosyltransferase involved in cell wall biosynthesis
MRVLFITTPDVCINKGGLYTQIIKTKVWLERMGYEIDLFDVWDPLKEKYNLVHLFRADVSLYDVARRLKKDRNFNLALSPVFASTHNLPILKTTAIANKISRRAKFFTLHHFVAELLRLANVILPNTYREVKLLSRGFGIPKSKFRVIPNGVDERFYFASPELFEKKYGIKDFILYVGHIGYERKNTMRLLKVLRKIDHPTVFIGPVLGGEYGERCMKEIHQNKNIRLIPPLPQDSPLLESAYAACDTFVLPSIYETPGIAALEAGLAGAKICITKYGGTEEYFGKYASYVNPRNKNSIYNGIIKTLEAKKDTDLKEHIRKNFLWEMVAKKTADVYQEVK